MKKAKIAVDEAKESVGGWVNVRLARGDRRDRVPRRLDGGGDQGNETVRHRDRGDAGATSRRPGDDVDALTGALIFAADTGLSPTTEGVQEQTEAMKLTEGETRRLIDEIDELATEGNITRESADEFMTTLDQQADSMESTREDGRLLSERYIDLATDADRRPGEGCGVPPGAEEAGRPDAETDRPGLRVAGRPTAYNAAFERWSDLAVSATRDCRRAGRRRRRPRPWPPWTWKSPNSPPSRAARR